VNENVKQHIVFNKRIALHTLEGENLENISETNKDANDKPRYTNEPNSACSL
jgi:hypothetical protein